ncbi:WYL domain-containing protein [Chitinophaga sp. 30R24]|uniref:WYL domain-containing protein n=1 Tax=Chitinophaga sp. 30R24 TaxID=3248838 RepID=UPI003B90DD4E
MINNFFEIGDIVAVKTHPYFNELTNLVISGDPGMIPPVMIVTEIFKSQRTAFGKDSVKEETVKYRCHWFSSNSLGFLSIEVFEADLKLIEKNTRNICPAALRRGDIVRLKSTSLELGKLKSFQHFEDNSLATLNGTTAIASQLLFLPPIMQVFDVQYFKTDKPLLNKKTGEILRTIPVWEVKCYFFNSKLDKLSEITLPLDALELLEEIDRNKLEIINSVVGKSGYLIASRDNVKTIVKPRSITVRVGSYYLRGYDVLLNEMNEILIDKTVDFMAIENPYEKEVPSFNIESNPSEATPGFIYDEITESSLYAISKRFYVRIKYKNRNDQISVRTIKIFNVVEVNENGTLLKYLMGFCLLRQEKRHFRIDRIQSLKVIILSYSDDHI